MPSLFDIDGDTPGHDIILNKHAEIVHNMFDLTRHWTQAGSYQHKISVTSIKGFPWKDAQKNVHWHKFLCIPQFFVEIHFSKSIVFEPCDRLFIANPAIQNVIPVVAQRRSGIHNLLYFQDSRFCGNGNWLIHAVSVSFPV